MPPGEEREPPVPAPDRIPLADHLADAAALLAAVRAVETLPLSPVLRGRVAAADVRAVLDVPGHDNSQMDGYALAAADAPAAGGPVTLPLGEPITAGDAPGELRPGTARAIMTGAPLPRGAELVVPVEESSAGRFAGGALVAGEPVTLTPAATDPGRFVRRRGSDTRAGDTVLRAGDALTAARIAHLASCGVREVPLWAPVRTVVLSTGSEVSAGEAPLAPGAAHDANGPGLAAALDAAGAEVVHRGAVPDDPSALLGRLRTAVRDGDADLMVTSGGVSQGTREVVRLAAEEADVDLTFPTLALQPGGPQGIGTLTVDGRRVAWIALPGNPVSALLGAELILRPALGAPARTRLRLPVRLDRPERPEASPPALLQVRRARVLPSGSVRLVGGPGSHLLGALAAADALVLVPPGVDAVHDGDLLETLLLPGGP